MSRCRPTIAILDFLNQDPGLKILFPEADYYVFKTEDCTRAARVELYKKHNITHSTDVEKIATEGYDTIMVIVPLYNCTSVWNGRTKEPNTEIMNYFNITLEILRAAAAQPLNIFFFDNSDYDYDPNLIFIQNNAAELARGIKFFKRAYMKNKIYLDNVVPFPAIMFGPTCMVDILGDAVAKIRSGAVPQLTENRAFFSGVLMVHRDATYGVVRNRREIATKIHQKLGHYFVYKNGLPYREYMAEMSRSYYNLDLLGCGDPNKRTFEIFLSGSLRIAQHSDLEWGFDESDDFCAETVFSDAYDLAAKLAALNSDMGLYAACLERQNRLVEKYLAPAILREYILGEMK